MRRETAYGQAETGNYIRMPFNRGKVQVPGLFRQYNASAKKCPAFQRCVTDRYLHGT
jgi:hypothetical protein